MTEISEATKGIALKNKALSNDEHVHAKNEPNEKSSQEQLIDCKTSTMQKTAIEIWIIN